MPKVYSKKHTPVRQRVIAAFVKKGVNQTHPLFSQLVEFTIEFKQYDHKSRVDSRSINWALFAFRRKEDIASQLEGLITPELEKEVNGLKPKVGSTSGLLARLSKKQIPQHYLVKATPRTAQRFEARIADKAPLGKSTNIYST